MRHIFSRLFIVACMACVPLLSFGFSTTTESVQASPVQRKSERAPFVSAFLAPFMSAAVDPSAIVLQPGPADGKDIWTTSLYSYAPGGSFPGGGLNNEELVIGGWGDEYHSLLQFDISALPARAVSVRLELFPFTQRGLGTTPIYLDRITQFWDWRTQGTGRDRERLWWADKPAATPWTPVAFSAPTIGEWYGLDITELYNGWKDGTYPNYGIQLRPQFNNNKWAEFYSSNYMGSPSLRPRLVIVPEDSVACAENCNSSVLFIPGLEASRLYQQGLFSENQLWEPNRDADAEKLFLNQDGTSVNDDIYTRDVIDQKLGFAGNIYKAFLDDLENWKTRDGLIADYAVTPYDWRLSLNDIVSGGRKTGDIISYLHPTTTPYIIQELRRLADTSRTGKVIIVAHSNGGLVVKALTEKIGAEEAARLIDTIVFVAVPQAGTPQSIGAILHGYDQGLPFDSSPLILSRTTARLFAKNMPGAYHLLPFAAYFSEVETPVITFDDSDFLADFRARYGAEIRSVDSLRTFITDTYREQFSSPSNLSYPSVGNFSLFTQAENIHAAVLSQWAPPAGVRLVQIAGWGEDTLGKIEYYEGKKTICAGTSPQLAGSCFTVSVLEYNPFEVVDGDGTVVAPSAIKMMEGEEYWVDLGDYNKWWLNGNIPRQHADILEVPSLRTLIKNIFTNTVTTTLPQFISTSTPTANPDDKRLAFILHSPLYLSAVDNLGNVLSSTTAAIPGGTFTRYGEVQVLKVPKGTPVTLTMDAYAQGSFSLDIRELNSMNAVISSARFSGVPSATSTIASISFSDGTIESATPLTVDYDGDTAADITLAPRIGEELVFDNTPPEARILFDSTSRTLSIEGEDEAGDTTVAVDSGSATITDVAGNVLLVKFKNFKEGTREIKLEIESIAYNGVSTGVIPKTILHYEWGMDKNGTLKELQQKVEAGGVKIEAHYDAKKNTTVIHIQKERGEDREQEQKIVVFGLVIIGLHTENGDVIVDY